MKARTLPQTLKYCDLLSLQGLSPLTSYSKGHCQCKVCWNRVHVLVPKVHFPLGSMFLRIWGPQNCWIFVQGVKASDCEWSAPF